MEVKISWFSKARNPVDTKALVDLIIDAERMHAKAVMLMPCLNGRPSPWREYWMRRMMSDG